MILKRWISGRLVLAALCLGLATGGASALDYNDVVQLLQNRVAENVIINMANGEPSLYITLEEANNLRAMGASERVIAALNPRPTTIGTGAAAASTVAVTTAMPADGRPIFPADIAISAAYPPRYDKEGFLSIHNRDWIPYYLSVNLKDKRMFLSKTPNGGILIQSGENRVINLRKEGYKLYGQSGEKLNVKVREGETTTLSLEPFGTFGNSGLTGVSTNRDNVRREVLFTNYVPPVVVQPPVVIQPPVVVQPPMVVQQPPVVVQQPPVIVQQPPVVVRPAPPPVVVVPAPPPPPRYYYYHQPPRRNFNGYLYW